MLSENQIIESLKKVNDPEIGKSLIELNMIKDIKIEDNNLSLTLELTTPACPLKSQIKKSIENELKLIEGMGNITVNITSRVRGKHDISQKKSIPGVKNIILVASGKGGVGKSTIAVNLAAAFAQMNAKTALLDADIYGPSIPIMMGIDNYPNTVSGLIPIEKYGIKLMSIGFLLPSDKAIIWRGPMVMKAITQLLYEVHWGEIDYMIIDMPPGTGDVQLTISQNIPVDGAVIVTTPQKVALADAIRGINMFNEVGIKVLGIIENMSYFKCPNCGKDSDIFSHGGIDGIIENTGISLLGKIPIEPSIMDSSESGIPAVIAHPVSEYTKSFINAAQCIASMISVINMKD